MSNNKDKAIIEETLKGSQDAKSIDMRIAFMTKLFEMAAKKTEHLSEMRQRNLNFALIVFAGLFTLTSRLGTDIYAVLASGAGFAVMLVFCLLDRRLHTYNHGWRNTREKFLTKINTMINYPERNLTYKQYYEYKEKKAEWNSLQPVIFYLLVLATAIRFISSIVFIQR